MLRSKKSSDIGKSAKSSSQDRDSRIFWDQKDIDFLWKYWIFHDFSVFARLFRGTLSIVLHFSGIKNVDVGSLVVFAFGKIDLVGAADLFGAIFWDQKVG
mgnify:FL=1